MTNLPEAPRESVIYEDEWLYVCLALYPLTSGHTIVVWKSQTADIHNLTDREYDYLMGIMDVTRDALLSTLSVEKVYLMYMDEAKQVHWHLVPRYDEKGVNVLMHTPEKTKDFSLTHVISTAFVERMKTRELRTLH